VSLFRASNLF
jgi:hypothetical protein